MIKKQKSVCKVYGCLKVSRTRGYCDADYNKIVMKNKCQKSWQKKKCMNARHKIFNILGKTCVCCGESTYGLLTIEHKNNDGSEHLKRSGTRYKMWDDIAGDPKIKEKYETLCHNCNWGRMAYGECPHVKTLKP